MSGNVIDIIERFQTRQALQEEQGMKISTRPETAHRLRACRIKTRCPVTAGLKRKKASTQRKSKSMEKK